MDKNEFYIGWMPEAPDSFAKHVRKVVIVLAILVVTTGIVLALQQRKFSTASFEFGQLTEVKGIYPAIPCAITQSNIETGCIRSYFLYHDAIGRIWKIWRGRSDCRIGKGKEYDP